MTQFCLFDSVQLLESVPLVEGDAAPEGTPEAIVEVFPPKKIPPDQSGGITLQRVAPTNWGYTGRG